MFIKHKKNRDIEEQKLIERLRLKEQSAWKEFYEFYSGHLTYVCMRYVKNQDDVYDILQNSFIKMFHSIDSFSYRGSGSLKAWITRLLINESLKFLRDNSKIDYPVSSDDLPILEEEEPCLDEIPESIILELIRSLPDGYRMVFNLYVFEEKSHKEIAQLLGIAESSSASQLHRAKKMLMQQIQTYNQFRANAL
ncbi:sigma-70 family RNA polymerase sigma factor [Myroides sp. M-43]|uniref:RNA polymerase sigma factor n=1 Tax=Myroides oncorhynchi TaxID=2893756 RepID=UPI001E4F81F8|nr:sigma-70 family RNA polymerase sigma factor [Myroides oncorhynchi]MCC9044349.1 sigma-70 family RNA polymerase sigma factor [Myroides oncorhynchi]